MSPLEQVSGRFGSHESWRGNERFVVEQTLGEGGVGVVYLVHDREQNRRVALKTLSRVDPSSLYRFKKEFRALAGVSHPNLVVLHELILDRDVWFFTMEYVEGVDFLAHVCDLHVLGQREASPTEPLGLAPMTSMVVPVGTSTKLRSPIANEPRLRDALRQLALGISALHAAGKLHKDIKPSNVMVTDEGRVVLLDFGMIDDSTDRVDVTLDDKLFGTPAYMSPEQAAGVATAEASDWYSFGAMLFEALTGRLPFDGSVLDILLRKQSTDAPSPSSLAGGIPADLEALCVALLAREPAARPTGSDVLTCLTREGLQPSAADLAPRSQARASFVGRERELAQLRHAFAQTRTACPSAVVVTGRSGIGKSALVRSFVESLRKEDRAVVFAGRCYERESLPFKGIDSVIDSLCHYLVRLSDADVSRLLPRDVRALARLFPVLRQVEVIEKTRFRVTEILDPQEQRRRGFAALKELLARLSDLRPIVISIDDVHWGDEDSAQLLQHILQPPDAPALLLLCCHREDGADGPLVHEIAKLDQSIPLCTIELGPLPESEAVVLVRRELAALGMESTSESELTSDRIAAEAEGSPYFIGELVLAFQREARSSRLPPNTPLSLEHVLRDRILLLPASARRLLEVVATAGRPIEQGLALAVADSGIRGMSDLDALRSAHFVRTHGSRDRDPLECYHDRVRQAVLGQIEPDVLRRHHLRLGELIEQAGRFQSDALAEHYFLAGDMPRAAHHALNAAREATDALAFDRAALLYRRVLELGAIERAERATLFASLGDVLVYAGRGADAAAAYLEASKLATGQLAFEHERKAAEHFLRSGHVDQGLPLLRRVLSAFDLALPKSPRRALVSLLLRRVRLGLRGLDYVEREEKNVPRELLARIDTCWSASVGLGLVDFVRGGDFQTRHCLLALEAGEPYRLARALALEAGYLAADGGKTETRVRDVLDLADRILDQHAHPHARGLTHLARAMAAWHLGHWQKSMPLCEEAERVFREQCRGATWEIATSQVFEAVARYYVGDWRTLCQRSLAHLREAIERGDQYAASDLRTGIHVLRYLATNDVTAARGVLDEEKRRWSHEGFHLQHWNQLLAENLIDLHAGEGESAHARVCAAWPALERSLVLNVQVVRIEAFTLRACSALAAGVAAPERRPELLREARRDAQRIARTRRPWAQPLADLVFGLCAMQASAPDAARVHFNDAIAGFDAHDMAMHASIARYRLGQLLGGDEGKVGVAAAFSSIASQGIESPDRVVRMLAPTVS